MTEWLRKDRVELAELAGQLRLTPEEALRAMVIGGQLVACGFTPDDVNNMRWDYMRMQRIAWGRWGWKR